ncbi:MAG: YgaP family membrane protein [Gemmatimonadales bacterium]
MSHDVGLLDRLIRVVLGILILGLYGALDPPLRYLTLIGLIPLGTGLLGTCLLYRVLGMSTSKGGAP